MTKNNPEKKAIDWKVLIERIQTKDKDAANMFVILKTPKIKEIISSILISTYSYCPIYNDEILDEAIVETFAQLFKKFKDDSCFTFSEVYLEYVCKGATSKIWKEKSPKINQKVAVNSDLLEKLDLSLTGGNTEDNIVNFDFYEFKEAMKNLKKDDRDLVVKHAYYGVPLVNLAAELKLNISTVRSRFNRAVKKIKRKLGRTI